jgi:pimeloyl-ACP methyl ester carboxylesterase
MTEILEGFPFWRLRFDEEGQPENAAAIDAFINEVEAQNLSDLFIFSHGWNNDAATALDLYRRFFGEMRNLIDDPTLPKRRVATIGAAGVIWPSIKWPDEGANTSGGAASLGSGASSDLFTELKKVFKTQQQQQTLEELLQLLEERARRQEALKQFKAKLSELIAGPNVDESSPDNLEQLGVMADDNNWRDVFEALADQEQEGNSGGGAVGLGDQFGKLWNGAKAALRQATYWQMKDRAGIIGRTGLGPLLGRLHAAAPNLKVHLIGHSFGARLVSYTLAGLPNLPATDKSPVKSLFLMQGAFSHFTFADELPFDNSRSGDLVGMASRVDGPLLTTHSLKDTAVGSAYPLASVVAGQDASSLEDPSFRWGAMGHDGAQAVEAKKALLGRAGTAYAFEVGRWLNLDGNRVIIEGDPPSGAHSDIVHPHTAWAALAAAGIG